MKNILIIVKNLTSGGAEKQSILLADLLSSHYTIHYIIFNGDKIHQKYLDALYENEKIKVHILKEGGKLKRLRSLRSYLIENRIEIIFSYLTAANLYAVIAAIALGIKVYIGLRNSQLPLKKRIVDKILTNYFSEKAIVNCFSGKENFSSQGFNINKLIVIPNCFKNIQPQVIKEKQDIVSIITVGRFVPQKDYETALKAISLLNKNGILFNYFIIGYGILETDIIRKVKELKLESKVKIIINPDNISKFLNSSDIYLSTSLFEGTSNSIMEAMNADLPVVGTNVGDNYELIENENNGYLCNVGDYEDICQKLSILIKNPDDRKRMGIKSKNILKRKYSIELFTERYINLLSKK